MWFISWKSWEPWCFSICCGRPGGWGNQAITPTLLLRANERGRNRHCNCLWFPALFSHTARNIPVSFQTEGASINKAGLPTFAWVNMKVDRFRVPSFVRRGKGEVVSAETSRVDPVMADCYPTDFTSPTLFLQRRGIRSRFMSKEEHENGSDPRKSRMNQKGSVQQHVPSLAERSQCLRRAPAQWAAAFFNTSLLRGFQFLKHEEFSFSLCPETRIIVIL